MSIIGTVRTAVRALGRNVMRSVLTALGVIIGVAAVIAMMEIGQGSARAIEQTISSMGANNVMVQSGAAASGGVSLGGGTLPTLTIEDVEAIKRECSHLLVGISPLIRARTQVVFGSDNWVPLFIYGVTPEFLTVRQWEDLDEGEPFLEQDVANAAQVCLIGQTLKRELFKNQSPVGREIRINNRPFRVVGVLSRRGGNMMGMDQDDIVLAPWTTIKYKVAGSTLTETNQSEPAKGDVTQQINTLNQRYPSQSVALYPIPSSAQALNTPQIVRRTTVDRVQFRVHEADQLTKAIEEMTAILRREHRLRPGEPDDFNFRDMTQEAEAQSSAAEDMRSLLLYVALISLVVGGIGIMNIMLVSVTERTREIGLRMAIGARSRDVLSQFLIEAILLCLVGGAIGVLVGRGVSTLVQRAKGWPIEPSLEAIMASVTVSIAVGVLFGFYPAWKASRLNPIEALRYE
jgi:ABC-type antimicrobial peptide transport system permease subunit